MASTQRHHSAAHLIHWALRRTLGSHVRQAGTSKTPDRMRFDFSHFEALTPDQLREVERLVNERVIENAKVEAYETDFDRKPEGTLAFFGEKYGKVVRVVDIGGYSRELCGGTHVAATGEIGLIKVVAEMAIAAGTRRIEAVAGSPALDLLATREAALGTVNARLNAGAHDVVADGEEDFLEQLDDEEALEEWLMVGLVDELREAGTVAQAGQCHGFKLLPVLGGEYDAENVYTGPLEAYWGACGDVHRQIDELPDGASIEIEIPDPPDAE